MTHLICAYCGKPTQLVKGSVIYPKREDLKDLNFYQCKPCEAYVGCHKGTTNPLGRVANAELRKWKGIAHKAFDALWKSGKLRRSYAYQLLAQEMQIKPEDCHIGMFSVQQCKQVYAICVNNKLEGKANDSIN